MSAYQPTQLPDDAQRTLAKLANRINSIRDQWLRLTYISALVYENARLTAECNDHRQARGFDPMRGRDGAK
jgi:hypothetical protein